LITNMAVIGAGYWGPNLIRNFFQIPNCQMKICCDLNKERLARIKSLYKDIEVTTDIQDILRNDSIDAVAIATPVYTHNNLALQCLENGKHVLIEKPLASSSAECWEMIQKAEEKDVKIMVGHTFEYVSAVNKAKEIIDSGELGEIFYVYAKRVNLGLFQPDINVIWDLAPHDISIILYLMDKFPISVNAQGKAHFKGGIEDVASTTLNFENGTIAFLHNSWLDPAKIRRTTIVGSKKMLVYDDIDPNEKLKIYDKGVEAPPYYDTYAEFQFSYRYGDILIPKVDQVEPLRKECQHFIDCIQQNKTPQTDGYNGLRVVTIIEAANESIRKDGTAQYVDLSKLKSNINKKAIA
jgi:predicted dehydrogenase